MIHNTRCFRLRLFFADSARWYDAALRSLFDDAILLIF